MRAIKHRVEGSVAMMVSIQAAGDEVYFATVRRRCSTHNGLSMF